MRAAPIIKNYEDFVEFNNKQKELLNIFGKRACRPINIAKVNYFENKVIIEEVGLITKRAKYKELNLTHFLLDFIKSSKYYIKNVEYLDKVDFTYLYSILHPAEYKKDLTSYAQNLFLIGEKRFNLGNFEVEIKSASTDNIELCLLNYIGKSAHIEIPNVITEIGERAFCTKGVKEIIIPDSVESIAARAFKLCDYLDKVVLPRNLKYLGEAVFQDSAIKEIEIPSSLEEIKPETFESCYNLKKVKLAKGLKKIGKRAFAHNYLLKSIKFPITLEEIGNDAFYKCTSLNEVKFAKGLKKIGNYAFAYTQLLKGMKLPITLKEIGDYAFL